MPEIPASSAPPPPPVPETPQGKFLKNAVILAMGAVSALYLINPTAGFLELIPDNIPLLGNLDEAGAMLLLINCFRHFGVDLSRIVPFMRRSQDDPRPDEKDVTPR